MTEYTELSENLKAISENVKYNISILSNASSLIWEYMDQLNWCGFYLFEDGKLILGPFQGKVACTEIQLGKGLCGTSTGKNRPCCLGTYGCCSRWRWMGFSSI